MLSLSFIGPKGRLAFGTGFIGASTTFSTFAVQSFSMAFLPALGNISANLFLTLTGVFFGRSFIKASQAGRFDPCFLRQTSEIFFDRHGRFYRGVSSLYYFKPNAKNPEYPGRNPYSKFSGKHCAFPSYFFL